MTTICQQRREQLLKVLPAGSAALIPAAALQLRNGDCHHPFRQSSDFYYLTDFDEPDALLLLRPDAAGAEQVLFCAPRNPLKERWDGPVVGPQAATEQLGIATCLPLDEMTSQLPKMLGNIQKLYRSASTPDADRRVAAVLGQCSLTGAAEWELANLDGLLHPMRLLKDAKELERMRTAAHITDAAHRRMMAAVRPGMKEYELEAECLLEFRRGGATAPAYPGIIGGGANACVLHYIRNDAELKEGDLVLVDAGCEYLGYAADITRTFPVSGRFGTEQKAVYEIVLQAQRRVIKGLAPGVPFARAQEIAVEEITAGLVDIGLLSGDRSRLIADRAYLPFYMHRVGHWLGMDVHDVGAYEDAAGEPVLLQEGMVMTVEPGIYIDDQSGAPPAWCGIGVRIEDDVLITATGAEILGASPPSDVAAVEALSGSLGQAGQTQPAQYAAK